MKLAAVSVVRNECDIVELFIRVNRRVVDRFFVVDNGSSDKTLDVLRALRVEGFPITIWACSLLQYYQGYITTHAMRQAFAEFAFDWCFLLDADEFLTAPRIEVEGALRAVAPDTLAGMKWRTWIPTSNDYAAHDNPLFSIFRPRRSELRQLIKLAVPGSLATSAILSKGNHSVAVGPSYAEVLKIPLDHAPVRSPEQLLTKVMINLRKTELKSKRGKHESYHLDQMASAVRRWGFRIESAEFLELAERYGLLPGDPISEVDLDVPGLGLASDRICYHGFHDVNLLERLDVFIGSLVGELKCCDADRFSALSHQEGVNEASIHFSATL